ncbi:hypothetical protein PS15m_004189 [Mucor circinelloides]
MENISRHFVKRVLAASERNSVVRRANRVGYHFPIKIMKTRMIKNISTAALRMRRFVSRSPSPVPEQSSEAGPDQEDEDGVLSYNEGADAFNYLASQNVAEHYNTTGPSAAAGANNDWWFEHDGFHTEEHEEEELNSDDDDEEINSYISFNDITNADDALPLVNTINTANEQDGQYQQQQVPATSSPVIGYGLDLDTSSDDYNLDLTASNESVTDRQLVATVTDTGNIQDGLSAAWSWLDNIDPENLTTAEIEQLLLTQTSELTSSNLAVSPTMTDNNSPLTQANELDSVDLVVASAITDSNHLSTQTSELTANNLETESAITESNHVLAQISELVSVDFVVVPTITNSIQLLTQSSNLAFDNLTAAPVNTDNVQYDNMPHEGVTDDENSSPESSNTSLSPSPPAKNRTATVNKEDDDQIWTTLNDANNYNLSAAPVQYHLPIQSHEYATAVNSLDISTNIATAAYPADGKLNARGTKRPLEDESDSPTPSKKHQGSQEYATAVNSLGISTNITVATYSIDGKLNAKGTKRSLEDGSDNPAPTKKHQGERAL